ncbi:GGDEF domain-containing protein [Vreelandella arcis]|uniref:diguanylate cyclase n=1 Tax=Vreelandella arcis TaxID=416873 RepID=A0A1H0JQW1_9GAMM|nr:GGDEF domain-containing protein [Halomonas arcis]SDO45930.1 diguanylate cyclase [Halomonas arcis]
MDSSYAFPRLLYGSAAPPFLSLATRRSWLLGLWIVTFLLGTLFCSIPVQAQQPVKDLQLIDYQGDFPPVDAPESYAATSLPERQNINLGINVEPVWLQFEVEDGDPTILQLDNPLIHHIALHRYLPETSRFSAPIEQVAFIPLFGDEPNRWRPVFELTEPGTYWLMLSSPQALRFSLSQTTLAQVDSDWRGFLLGQGLYLGMLLGLMVYNVVLLIFLKDSNYFWYLGFVGSSAAYFFLQKGLIFELAPRFSPLLNEALLFTALSIGIISALSFCRSFLMLSEQDRLMDRLFLGFITFGLVCLAGTWWLPGHVSVLMFSLLGLGTLTLFCLASWRALGRRFRPARWLLMGWSALVVGSLAFILSIYGVIPHNVLTYYGFQFGSALESLLLSLALADRINLLRRERETLAKEKLRFATMSVTDGLTGLYNRRYLTRHLEDSVQQTQHNHQPLSLLMLDIDHFKAFNDEWGHLLGDKALQHFADILVEIVRDDDAVCRFGGEEFTIVLRHQPLPQALDIAERIRTTLRTTPLMTDTHQAITLTCTIGAVQYSAPESAKAFLARADAALYQGKQDGRDRVIGDSAMYEVST